jgi:aspartyl-tRNA(Asn)/glutamyl-tRNA(Gln) amidotransferase subunit B
MHTNGGDPSSIMADKGVALVSDEGALVETVRKIIGEQAKAVADYKAGKEASLQFLVGQAMKALKGQGEPNMLMDLFKRELSS